MACLWTRYDTTGCAKLPQSVLLLKASELLGRCLMAARQLSLRVSGSIVRHIRGHETIRQAGPSFLEQQWMPFVPLFRFLHSHRPESYRPVTKVRIRKDRPLDTVASKEKELKPIIVLRDALLRFKKAAAPLKVLLQMRRRLGLKISDEKIVAKMKRYPNIFDFFVHPDEEEQYCRLTEEVFELLEEERLIHKQQEPVVVEKLQKLLMLSKGHEIATEKLVLAARFFGIPEDFVESIVPKYPQHFRLLRKGKRSQALQLVAWDQNLAITEFEKKAKAKAREDGLGEIVTNGQPLAFPLRYSPGTQLRKHVKKRIDEWQRLPYISPYQDNSWVQEATPLADRKMVALLHEIVSLTIEKKITLEVMINFQEDFKLPLKVAKTFNRFPGVFYISLKGNIHTIFLREGYEKKQLIVDHPLINLKMKYFRMLINGPRLRSMNYKAKHSTRMPNAASGEDKTCDDMGGRVNASQDELEPHDEILIDDEAPSDLEEFLNEFEFSDSGDEAASDA